ncbi:MAG: methyltransferase [Nitrospirales bacterium]
MKSTNLVENFMTPGLRNALSTLGSIIIKCGYADLYPIYGSLHSEGPRPLVTIGKQVQDFPEPLRSFVQLFLLGLSCPTVTIESCFNSQEEFFELIRARIFIVNDDDTVSSPLVLLIFMGYLVFFERRTVGKDIQCYMGDDSLALASHLMPPLQGQCLDLCTGSGIQALLSSSRARRVIGVDLQDRAVEIATMNCELNGCGEHVEFRKGNLFLAIEDEQFDFICANPPLLPGAENLRNPIVADGGHDGLEIIRTIIQGLPSHLNIGGRSQVIGTALGDGKGPYCIDEFAKLSKTMYENGEFTQIIHEFKLNYPEYYR